MRKFIQYIGLYLHTFIIKHKRELTLSFVVGFFLTLLAIQSYPIYVSLTGQKHLKIGIVGNYKEDNLPPFILNQLSLGLTKITDSNIPVQSLATSWEIQEDGKKYVIHLKNDAFWHDGKKLVAGDINLKFKGATFSATNDNTLEIKMSDKFAPVLSLLSQPILRPGLIGLGQYKAFSFAKNGDNITKISLKPQNKNLPYITYRVYPTNQDAVLGFKLGEVNMLYNITDPLDLKNWNTVKITETTMYDRFVGLFFNLKETTFKEKDIRHALAYAIPKFDSLEKAYTPISPLSWAYSSKVRLYNYDFNLARTMLDKSPLASSSSQIVISTFAPLVSKAQIIADAWNKVGVNTKIRVENSIPSDYQVFLLTQNIPTDPDQYPFWQSTQDVTNITHYSNPKIDKLLEDGRKTIDMDPRKKIYADFQKYLVDDAPVIFLFYPKMYTIEKK